MLTTTWPTATEASPWDLEVAVAVVMMVVVVVVEEAAEAVVSVVAGK